ncbi:MAG: CaiB/BaiF CoA transferase family protein [Thermoplasmata archaeon]
MPDPPSVPASAPLVPPFGPLAGVRVVDSGRFVAGPWAATYLGEFGAEVVHVERPPFCRPYADPTRSLPPLLPVGAAPERQVSESWVQYGRNKLSIGLDIATDEGRELFLELLDRSDIWIESSRPGTYDRLGLADATVRARCPRLTVVHVSGYGQSGEPDRTRAPSYDLIAQAFSGFLAIQGNPEPAPPMRAGTALNDTVTGLAAAAAALMGHIAAARTGRGQVVDVAQYEVFFTLLENMALDFFSRGVVRGRHGNSHARLHPYDLYRARDGYVVLAAPTPDAWRRVAALVGATDPRWDDMTFRVEHREEVNSLIAAWAARHTIGELEAIGRSHDTAISRIFDMAAIAEDPHYRARGMFVSWEDPIAGPVTGAGFAPKFGDTPGGVWRGAPWLGQDNEPVVLGRLGHSAEELRGWRARGIIGEDPPPGPSDGMGAAPLRASPPEAP